MSNSIFEPLQLARGSHEAGSGKGCAMNVISWENGDVEITDFPSCSDRYLSLLVQRFNDTLAGPDGLLSPEDSLVVLELGHATVDTAYHNLSVSELASLYADFAKDSAAEAAEAAKYAAKAVMYAANAAKAAKAAEHTKYAAEYAAEYTKYAARDAMYAAEAAKNATSKHIYNTRDEYKENFRKMIADIIQKFKDRTGTNSPEPDSAKTQEAVSKMLVKTN